jgi:ketosteroid isomerase-like protein
MARSNVELVERVYQAFRRRDFPEIFSLCRPDVEVAQSLELPWGGEYHGHEEVTRYFGTLTKHISSSVVLDRFIDAGDQVVAVGRTRGTVLHSGRRFDVPVVHVWHVRDGLIAKFLPYLDVPMMRAVL